MGRSAFLCGQRQRNWSLGKLLPPFCWKVAQYLLLKIKNANYIYGWFLDLELKSDRTSQQDSFCIALQYPIYLLQFLLRHKHDNYRNLLLINHEPEVSCSASEGSLCCNEAGTVWR